MATARVSTRRVQAALAHTSHAVGGGQRRRRGAYIPTDTHTHTRTGTCTCTCACTRIGSGTPTSGHRGNGSRRHSSHCCWRCRRWRQRARCCCCWHSAWCGWHSAWCGWHGACCGDTAAPRPRTPWPKRSRVCWWGTGVMVRHGMRVVEKHAHTTHTTHTAHSASAASGGTSGDGMCCPGPRQ